MILWILCHLKGVKTTLTLFHRSHCLPFRMAAFPDLMANDAILAITSGRASKIRSRTPIGQLTRSRSRPSSRRVLRVVFPTEAYRASRSHAPQWSKLSVAKEAYNLQNKFL